MKKRELCQAENVRMRTIPFRNGHGSNAKCPRQRGHFHDQADLSQPRSVVLPEYCRFVFLKSQPAIFPEAWITNVAGGAAVYALLVLIKVKEVR
jgi:hypothetical protein